MRSFFQKILKKESGNALVLATLMMGGILTLTGLVIDGGHLYIVKSHLQKTANAAALSGAQELPNEPEVVDQIVDDVLNSHGENGSLAASIIEDKRQLHVGLKKDVPVFFSSLFGIEQVPIKVGATAAINPMGEAIGAVPLGIDEEVELIYGESYTLKVDAGDSEAGNFGVLALKGPGAKTYEETLTNGFDQAIKVGDVIETQTGNIAGATRDGIDYRIDHCPDPTGELIERDCSRVMLVLVYRPHEVATNQMKSVEITGFAYFYVTERMGNNDDSINGIFIKRTGTGITGTGNPSDRGAYAIKLTE